MSIDLQKLKKPLQLKWRVQRAFPNKINPTHVIMIGYVDSRQVQEHFDECVGPENWQDDYYECKGKQFCRIGVRVNGEWIWKSDSGEETSTSKLKGETSDSFKRAAVKWGVNRVAYRVGEVKLPCKMYSDKPYPCDESGAFLKGQKLFDICNKLGKIEDYEIEFDKSFDEISDAKETVKAVKDKIRGNYSKPKMP